MSRARGPANTVGSSVRGEDLWGREGEIAELWKRLHRGSVLITGPRRHGKSSVMHALADRPQAGWIVEYVDVEYVCTPDEFLVEVTAALLTHDKLRRRILGGLARGTSRFASWVGTLAKDVGFGREQIGELRLTLRDALSDKRVWPELSEQLLSQLQRIEDERLLIIIDEFPMMIGTFLDRDSDGAVHFLRWFRSIRQRRDTGHVRFLLGGSVNIEPRLERMGQQALLNDLDRLIIEPFPRARAVEFVAAVLATEGLGHEPGVPTEIVRVADCGVPFFLQVLIQECSADARRHARTLAVAHVEPVYQERVLGPANKGRFSHYHTRLREHYGELEELARVVLDELVRRQPLAVDDLVAAIQRAGEDRGRLEPTLTLLESDYYIERERDQIRFANGFLRSWWQRHAARGRS